MPFQAIIFDLFFTLIDPLGGASGEETEYTVLGMDRADFEARNRLDYEVRGCGKIRDPYRMMAHILRGLDIPDDLLRRAADARLERIKRALYGADPKNIALLNRLREAGYKTALISNADIADIYYWADSPLSACFDETVFSYDVELLKPDPRIYRLALERLQVKPDHCLFVGDGGHRELRGAREAGMITVLTTEYIPGTEKIERLKIDADYTVEKLEAIAEIEEIKQTLRDYQNNKEPCAVQEKTETILKRTSLDTLLLKTLEKIQNSDFIDLAAPLETLHLSARSFNALSRAGITTVGMMLDADKETLQEIKQLGVKSIGEILDRQEKIKDFALTKEGDGIAAKQERIQRLTDAFRRIPASRLNKSPQAYLSSYCGVDIKSILSDFEPLLGPLRTIAEIPSVFEKVSLTRKSTNDFISILNVISLDLRAMVQKLLAGIYNNPKNGRLLSILQQRYNGLTLQQIADKSGLTRERIRQLKTKGFDMLVKHLHTINIDMLIFINADYNGDYLLTTREICRYFDDLEHIDILLYAAKMQGMSNIFKYHKHFDIFFHADRIQNIDNIVEAVKNLPYIIEIENRDTLLSGLCMSENIPMKAAAIEFDYAYKLACKVYHKKNLITTQMYEYVLEHYYPNGIRLYDDETIQNFRKRVIETFGDIELPKNDRAIDARLADIAILCDRGAYIHPHHIGIDKALIEEICTYVNDSSRIIFSFNEIFEIFKDKLFLYSNIHNKYFLQGMLKYYLEDRFFITRYTISKKENTNLIEDIEEFIRIKGEAHKSEIFAEYAGITEIMLSIKVNANRNLINIGKGWYMHADRLRIEKRDYHLKKILEEHTRDIPISTRKLLELLWLSSSGFLTRNTITDHDKLFGVLKYMFDGEFTFSRPYIAISGTDRLSSIHVIRQHLRSYNTITIADLVDLCRNYQLYFFSIRVLIRDLSNEFLRINAKTITRINTGFDEETLAEIAKPILEKLNDQGYIAVSMIKDYRDYPDIGFEWNSFILRSIVEKYLHDTISIIDIYTTDTYTMNSIFADPFLDIENYESLIHHILTVRNSEKPFDTISGAIEWLQRQGLLLVNTPKFLLDGSVIRFDKHGKVTIAK